MKAQSVPSFGAEKTNLLNQAQARSKLLFGTNGLERLKQAHVMVVGCGAVGGIAIEALARTHIGHITVVDFDTFTPSNLNRQILATLPAMGALKTEIAANRILSINPNAKVNQKRIIVNEETVDTLFNQPVDFVIDAIDSLHAKTILIESLIKRKTPFISSMGAALKTDLTRIRITSMNKTTQCPLAAFLRKRLRRRGVDLSFPVVYSDECVSDKIHLGEVDPTNGRHEMGSMMTVTNSFGLMCAHYAILHIVNQKETDE